MSQFIYAQLCVWIDWLLFFCSKRSAIIISKTIYIRNVDSSVLTKIDELAEQKGVSRNKFVNIILENFAFTDKIKETESRYSGLVETTTDAINNVTLAVQQLQQLIIEANNDNGKDNIL